MTEEQKERLRVLAKTGGAKAGGKSKKGIEMVANNVIEQIKKKERPNISKAMRDVGYSENTVKSKCSEIIKNPVYLRTLNNFLDSLKEKSAMSLANITEKKLKKASVRDLVYTTDVLTKNANLIEGKPTSIEAGMGAFLLRIEKAAEENKDLPK